jgi:hypothetical protein
MAKRPRQQVPEKKWWQRVVAVLTVTTGIVAAIAAFSNNALSIRDNFWKLFGESTARVSFSLQHAADIHKVVFLVSNTGPKPATMLGASLHLNNPDSLWTIPLELGPDDATVPGDSAKVVSFKVPNDVGGRVRIVTGSNEESPRCLLSVAIAGLGGSTQQYTEIFCGDLAFLMIGLQTKIGEAKKNN